MKNYNILIVEDQFVATQYLRDILYSTNLISTKNIFTSTNSNDAIEIVKEQSIDIVFMDINIKGATDGITCAKIINQHYPIPVIFTTAYNDLQTIQEASESNLHGYITKPFKAGNVESTLLITLKLIRSDSYSMKKTPSYNTKETVCIDEYTYNLHTHSLIKGDVPIKLTKKELQLIDIFFLNINQNISYETFKEKIWNNQDISNSTLRDTVSKLKRKIPELHLQNINGYGYLLKK